MTDATHRPYRVDATQKEKAAILKSDQRVRSGSTFLDHTHDDEGGRFAKSRTVIGSEATAQYPMVGPNWANDPTGVEPPLGFDVNAIEPVGEYGEIQASLIAVDDPAKPEEINPCHLPASGAVGSSLSPLAAVDAPLAADPSGDVRAPAANPNPQRRRAT
jgi:hypothetical protein